MTQSKDSPLDNFILSYSCPVAWSNMVGDERERLCKQCDKKVYNISDMTKAEANALLVSKQEESTCYNYYLRPDGTIKTDNCPRMLRPARDKLKWIAHACSFLLAGLCSFSEAIGIPQSTNQNSRKSVIQGTGIGGGMGNPESLRSLIRFPFDAADLEDKELTHLRNKFNSMRTLSDGDFDAIETYYNQKGMKAKSFLVRQAKLKHFSTRSNPTDSEKNNLELDRAKVIDQIIESANEMLSAGEGDKAIRELETCIKVAQDPYNRLMTACELPTGIERVPFSRGGFTQTLIMSDKAQTAFVEVLEKSQPKTADALASKVRLLQGMGKRSE